MKKSAAFQFRKLVRQIAPVMKVYIVHNDRCEPHGARLLAKLINSFNCYYGNFPPVTTAFITC